MTPLPADQGAARSRSSNLKASVGKTITETRPAAINAAAVGCSMIPKLQADLGGDDHEAAIGH